MTVDDDWREWFWGASGSGVWREWLWGADLCRCGTVRCGRGRRCVGRGGGLVRGCWSCLVAWAVGGCGPFRPPSGPLARSSGERDPAEWDLIHDFGHRMAEVNGVAFCERCSCRVGGSGRVLALKRPCKGPSEHPPTLSAQKAPFKRMLEGRPPR